MLNIIEGMPDNVVAVNATSKVTGEDYDHVLIPLMGRSCCGMRKFGVLYVMGPDFSGFTAEAVCDDAKVGLSHLTTFRKVAVVSDVSWVVKVVRFFSFAIPCPVRVFANEKLPEAKVWVSG